MKSLFIAVILILVIVGGGLFYISTTEIDVQQTEKTITIDLPDTPEN